MEALDKNRITPSQAATLLGVTPNRVRQLMREGRLRFEWTPLGRLIERTSLEQLREQRLDSFRASMDQQDR